MTSATLEVIFSEPVLGGGGAAEVQAADLVLTLSPASATIESAHTVRRRRLQGVLATSTIELALSVRQAGGEPVEQIEIAPRAGQLVDVAGNAALESGVAVAWPSSSASVDASDSATNPATASAGPAAAEAAGLSASAGGGAMLPIIAGVLPLPLCFFLAWRRYRRKRRQAKTLPKPPSALDVLEAFQASLRGEGGFGAASMHESPEIAQSVELLRTVLAESLHQKRSLTEVLAPEPLSSTLPAPLATALEACFTVQHGRDARDEEELVTLFKDVLARSSAPPPTLTDGAGLSPPLQMALATHFELALGRAPSSDTEIITMLKSIVDSSRGGASALSLSDPAGGESAWNSFHAYMASPLAEDAGAVEAGWAAGGGVKLRPPILDHPALVRAGLVREAFAHHRNVRGSAALSESEALALLHERVHQDETALAKSLDALDVLQHAAMLRETAGAPPPSFSWFEAPHHAIVGPPPSATEVVSLAKSALDSVAVKMAPLQESALDGVMDQQLPPALRSAAAGAYAKVHGWTPSAQQELGFLQRLVGEAEVGLATTSDAAVLLDAVPFGGSTSLPVFETEVLNEPKPMIIAQLAQLKRLVLVEMVRHELDPLYSIPPNVELALRSEFAHQRGVEGPSGWELQQLGKQLLAESAAERAMQQKPARLLHPIGGPALPAPAAKPPVLMPLEIEAGFVHRRSDVAPSETELVNVIKARDRHIGSFAKKASLEEYTAPPCAVLQHPTPSFAPNKLPTLPLHHHAHASLMKPVLPPVGFPTSPSAPLAGAVAEGGSSARSETAVAAAVEMLARQPSLRGRAVPTEDHVRAALAEAGVARLDRASRDSTLEEGPTVAFGILGRIGRWLTQTDARRQRRASVTPLTHIDVVDEAACHAALDTEPQRGERPAAVADGVAAGAPPSAPKPSLSRPGSFLKRSSAGSGILSFLASTSRPSYDQLPATEYAPKETLNDGELSFVPEESSRISMGEQTYANRRSYMSREGSDLQMADLESGGANSSVVGPTGQKLRRGHKSHSQL